MSKFIPNSFQVPNVIIDELIADMSEAELKCFLFVIRKTTGWQKEMDAISISQFMESLKLSKQSVISGCDRLVDKGLLVKTKGFRGTNVFSLNWSKILTSQENGLVKNLDITCQDFRQDPVKNLDTQTNTIQKTLKQNTNNPPISPQGEPSRRKSPKSRSAVEIEHPELVELPEYINRESWIAYCKMRKAKRSAIKTEQTLRLCLRDLAKHSGGNPDLATAILEQSIANCWTGLFALKSSPMPTTTKPSAHHGFAEKDYTPSSKWGEPEWVREAINES